MRLVYPLPFSLQLEFRGQILFTFEKRELLSKLHKTVVSIRRNRTIFHRGQHGTAGFRDVPAISKPAFGREVIDFLEGVVHVFLAGPQLNFTHSRCVDQQSSRWKYDETSRRCRVAAPAVVENRTYRLTI